MKHLVIFYISTGLLLSVGVQYSCVGKELYSDYFGTPFVFTQKSAGSSLEYFYSVSGLLLNIVIWSVILMLIRLTILELIKKVKNNTFIKTVCKSGVLVLIVFSSVNIAIECFMFVRALQEGAVYWFMDFDEQAKKHEVDCSGEWVFFNK